MKCPVCGEDFGDVYESICPRNRCVLPTLTPQTEDVLPPPPPPDPVLEDPFPPAMPPAPEPIVSSPSPGTLPISNPIPATIPISPPMSVSHPVAPPPVSVSAAPAGSCVRCGGGGGPICRDCSALPAPTLILEVEGFDPVRHRGRRVQRVPIVQDEMLIGRRDAGQGIYPEIDLQDFHAQGYIGRRHAQIVRERGKHYLIHVHPSEPTGFSPALGQDLQPLSNNDRRELQPGNRFVIGDAVGFRVLGPDGVA